jgi:hypothetical protein
MVGVCCCAAYCGALCRPAEGVPGFGAVVSRCIQQIVLSATTGSGRAPRAADKSRWVEPQQLRIGCVSSLTVHAWWLNQNAPATYTAQPPGAVRTMLGLFGIQFHTVMFS